MIHFHFTNHYTILITLYPEHVILQSTPHMQSPYLAAQKSENISFKKQNVRDGKLNSGWSTAKLWKFPMKIILFPGFYLPKYSWLRSGLTAHPLTLLFFRFHSNDISPHTWNQHCFPNLDRGNSKPQTFSGINSSASHSRAARRMYSPWVCHLSCRQHVLTTVWRPHLHGMHSKKPPPANGANLMVRDRIIRKPHPSCHPLTEKTLYTGIQRLWPFLISCQTVG